MLRKLLELPNAADKERFVEEGFPADLSTLMPLQWRHAGCLQEQGGSVRHQQCAGACRCLQGACVRRYA